MLSLKQNIEMVKERLSAEEQFFEKAVVTERFVKKYKNSIIAVVALVVVVAIANVAYDINAKSKKDTANKALLALLEDRNNQNALSELKSASGNLYELFKYKDAIDTNDKSALNSIKNSKQPIIADMAKYESATSSDELKNYMQNSGAIYKELAELSLAVELLKESKKDEAHKILQGISSDSSLKSMADALLHYGVK